MESQEKTHILMVCRTALECFFKSLRLKFERIMEGKKWIAGGAENCPARSKCSACYAFLVCILLMTFRREKIKDYILLDTSVENLFINEYMAAAPGDFVKVYLFAQMYADLGQEITNEEIAKYLSMEHEDVLRAWTYWEKMGVIRKIRRESADKFDYDVEFVLLKEQFYGDKESKRPVGLDQSMQAAMGDKEIQEMFQAIETASGNVLSGTEMLEIVSWINDFNATPEVIAYGYAYCVKRKKTNIKYIAAGRGCCRKILERSG